MVSLLCIHERMAVCQIFAISTSVGSSTPRWFMVDSTENHFTKVTAKYCLRTEPNLKLKVSNYQSSTVENFPNIL